MAKGSNGRDGALKQTLDTLTKKYGEGAIMRLGDAQNMVVESIPTGCLSLDISLKSTALNHPVRPLSVSTSSPKPKNLVVFVPL